MILYINEGRKIKLNLINQYANVITKPVSVTIPLVAAIGINRD